MWCSGGLPALSQLLSSCIMARTLWMPPNWFTKRRWTERVKFKMKCRPVKLCFVIFSPTCLTSPFTGFTVHFLNCICRLLWLILSLLCCINQTLISVFQNYCRLSYSCHFKELTQLHSFFLFYCASRSYTPTQFICLIDERSHCVNIHSRKNKYICIQTKLEWASLWHHCSCLCNVVTENLLEEVETDRETWFVMSLGT